MTDEWRATPIDAEVSAVDVPRSSVARIDEHLARTRAGPPPEPAPSPAVRATQGFVRRAVDYLAAETGIRQFVDLASRLPVGHGILDTARVHEPGARVVYVDPWRTAATPPLRGKAGRSDNAVPVLAVESMRPSCLVGRLKQCGLVDFGEPVAVLLVETSPLRRDGVGVHEVVSALHAEMAPGGHIAIAQPPAGPRHDVSPAPMFTPFTLLAPGLADAAWWPYPDEDVAAEGSGSWPG